MVEQEFDTPVGDRDPQSHDRVRVHAQAFAKDDVAPFTGIDAAVQDVEVGAEFLHQLVEDRAEHVLLGARGVDLGQEFVEAPEEVLGLAAPSRVSGGRGL